MLPAFLNAEVCPHPQRHSSVAIYVQGGRRAMVLCRECKSVLTSLIEDWHSHSISPSQVVAVMRDLGYSRLDAARFLLQLLGDRLKLRVGLLSEADL